MTRTFALRLIGVLAVFTVAVVLNLEYLSKAFWTDDERFYEHLIAKPSEWWRILTPYWGWLYRPVQLIYLNVAFGIFGFDAAPMHALSLLIHFINSLLVGWLTYRLLAKEHYAWLTTFIFALALNVQGALWWISAVSSLLVTLFSLTAFHLWLTYRKRPTTASFLLFLAACILAMGSREEGAILPFVLIVIDALMGFRLNKAAKIVYPVMISLVIGLVWAAWTSKAYINETSISKILMARAIFENRDKILFPEMIPEFIHYVFMNKFLTYNLWMDSAILLIYTAIVWRDKAMRYFWLWAVLLSVPLPLVAGKLAKGDYYHYLSMVAFSILWSYQIIWFINYFLANVKLPRLAEHHESMRSTNQKSN